MKKLDVPFISNTSDNLHCFEAALYIILKYFDPSSKYSFDELDKITEKETGMSTWPQAGILWMQNQGYEVINIEIFDYERFIEEGIGYLRNFYGEVGAAWQEKYSHISKEQSCCKDFIAQIKTEKRLPSVSDIQYFIDSGYLLTFLINSRALDNLGGYVGHVVVGIGYDENGIYFHDPGLPARESYYVSWQKFEKAWAFPDENAKNLTAFKKIK